MVFSSVPFLFFFLPITVLLYFFLNRFQAGRYCMPLLFCASLFYYAYWKPVYVSIIIFSMLLNFSVGQVLGLSSRYRKIIFILGIAANLGMLCYFKYTNFFLDSLNTMLDDPIPFLQITLPIGISFYTFQQIAYLSDIYTGKHDPTAESFLSYGLFVTFFPQLVAGPIVHHREVMPQFSAASRVPNWQNMYMGLCFLSMGLAKKVLIADTLSPIVRFCFDEAYSLTFPEALLGSLAYTLQLYFDFSGYTDMAIGCALFFNIHLPENFNSPYKAVSIQDFWRRWHMTLSRWLRDYLYIPLGGNKHGTGRTLGNLFLTFLIGGIWHGAGWTFVLWGVLHGGALVVHRIWSKIWGKSMPALCGWALTFLFVSLAWIPFRAVSFERLTLFVDGLLGYNGFAMRQLCRNAIIRAVGLPDYLGFTGPLLLLLLLLLVVLRCRNSQEILQNIESKKLMYWVSALLFVALLAILSPGYKQEFIYFQF